MVATWEEEGGGPLIFGCSTQPAHNIARNSSQHTLVEREAFVQAFSPGSTLEPGLKAFHRRGPKCPLEHPPLVPVGTTNRD
jgi:hypothetical protein